MKKTCNCGYEKDNGHSPECPLYEEKKHEPIDIEDTPISECCDALMRKITTADGSYWWECESCKKPAVRKIWGNKIKEREMVAELDKQIKDILISGCCGALIKIRAVDGSYWWECEKCKKLVKPAYKKLWYPEIKIKPLKCLFGFHKKIAEISFCPRCLKQL